MRPLFRSLSSSSPGARRAIGERPRGRSRAGVFLATALLSGSLLGVTLSPALGAVTTARYPSSYTNAGVLATTWQSPDKAYGLSLIHI